MGGNLWYEDRFPVGSKFRFIVTLAGTEHAAAELPIDISAST